MEPAAGPNPYAFTEAATAAGEDAAPNRRKTTRLTMLAALLLMMGIWGALTNPIAGAALLIQSVISTMPIPRGDQRQQEVDRRMDAANDRLLPATWASLVVNFLLSIPMIVGAVGLLKRKEWARILTVRTIWANLVAAVFEVVFAAVALYLQYSILLNYVEELSATAPFGDQARVFTYALVAVQIVVMLAMYGFEFAVYWFGIRYLRRDDVRAMFA